MSSSSSPAPLSPSSSSPPLPSSTSVLSSLLDTDDPFNARKKKPLIPSSPTSFDDLPLSGSRAAQRLSRLTDDADAEAGKENDAREMKESDDSAPPPLPSRITAPPPIKKPREPRVPLRARVKASTPSPPQSDDLTVQPPLSSSTSTAYSHATTDDDQPPLNPRSSATTLAAMLDTDDPFNTKKKGGAAAASTTSLDDLPIAGSKSAQAMSAYPEDEAPLRGGAAPARPFLDEAAGGDPPPLPARPAPPARRPVARKVVAAGEAEHGGGEDEESVEVVAPVKKRPPVRTRLKLSAAAEPALPEDDGAGDAESATSAPSSFDDAPIPRSSAATLAAMLDTDDPFNTKKKPLTASLDDLPIGGSKNAPAMPAYPDDAPAELADDASAAPLPRRAPVRFKPKAADDDADAPSDSNPSPPADPQSRPRPRQRRKKRRRLLLRSPLLHLPPLALPPLSSTKRSRETL